MFKTSPLLVLALAGCQPVADLCWNATAVDGDTIKCADGTRLRLNGVDAPELPGHHHHSSVVTYGDGIASAIWMHQLIDGQQLTYEPLKTDRYGRTVAEVKLGQTDLSCAAMSSGNARYVPQWDEERLVERTCR